MTKVQIRFQLQTPLSENELARLADARGVYGMLRFDIDETAGRLTVEYDATRLDPNEVEAVLHRAGIPAVKE